MTLVRIPNHYCQSPPERITSQWLNGVTYICNHFDVRVSSAYRTPAQNDAAGGAPNSDHLRGDAADFVGSTARMRQLHNWADDRFPYVEPMAEAVNHVHISFRHGGRSVEAPPVKHRLRPLGGRAFARRVWRWCNVYDLDPIAMVAVGSMEGANGEIGDHGTSYGPWQLRIQGALPAKWARLGPYSEKTLAWSWSDSGIRYVCRSVSAHGGAGRRGANAAEWIIRNFERPAAEKMADEIAGARHHYAMAASAPGGPRLWTAYRFLGPHGTTSGGNGGGEGGDLHPPPPGVAGTAWTEFIHTLSRHLPAKRRQLTHLANSIRQDIGG